MDGNEDNYKYIFIISIIYIVLCTIFFVINFTIFFFHIKQPLLKTNFFRVVFIQLILETALCLTMVIFCIITLIIQDNKEWYLSFYIIINFCIITDVFYNILILIYLIYKSSDKKESEEEENEDSLNIRGSIAIAKHSFKFIHFISLALGLIHTAIFILFSEKEDLNINAMLDWFYFFMPIKVDIYKIFFFSPYLVLFSLSIPYMCLSKDKLKVTDYIHLKHYCIICLFLGIVGLIIPGLKEITFEYKGLKVALLFFSSAFMLLYLFSLCFFRYNCYYIAHILSSEGNECSKKIKLFLGIMIFKNEVPKPNFIDFNNPFIFHSLAYESDFNEKYPQDVRASFASKN